MSEAVHRKFNVMQARGLLESRDVRAQALAARGRCDLAERSQRTDPSDLRAGAPSEPTPPRTERGAEARGRRGASNMTVVDAD